MRIWFDTIEMARSAMPKTTLKKMRERHAQLDRLLHDDHQDEQQRDHPLKEQPLRHQLRVFREIAKGKRPREQTSPAFARVLEAAVEQLLQVLYEPLDGSPMLMPRDAWHRTELGPLLAQVTMWLYGPDLISMVEAAQLLYDISAAQAKDVARIRWLIQTGRLRHYWDPHEPNYTHAQRVRKSEVLQLKRVLEASGGRLPE